MSRELVIESAPTDYPVAFIDPEGGIYWCSPVFFPQEPQALFMDPIQRQPLTEEQIDDIAAEHSDEFGNITPDDWQDFAKALLEAYKKNVPSSQQRAN